MKQFITAAVCFFAVFGTLYGKGIADDVSRISGQADTSYAMGMVMGEQLRQTGMVMNYGAFTRGLKDTMEGKETDISMDEAILRIQVAYNVVLQEQTEKNKEEERQFLEENGRREGVLTTASGLQYEVITEGEGARPGPADRIRVNYEGSLLDGTVFDNSYDRGEPAEFSLMGVIPGWAEGMQLMTVGSTYRFYIPSKLAFGEQGAEGFIPPSALVIFDVELLEILEQEPFEEEDYFGEDYFGEDEFAEEEF